MMTTGFSMFRDCLDYCMSFFVRPTLYTITINYLFIELARCVYTRTTHNLKHIFGDVKLHLKMWSLNDTLTYLFFQVERHWFVKRENHDRFAIHGTDLIKGLLGFSWLHVLPIGQIFLYHCLCGWMRVWHRYSSL